MRESARENPAVPRGVGCSVASCRLFPGPHAIPARRNEGATKPVNKIRTAGVWVLLVVIVFYLAWRQQSQEPNLTMTFAEFVADVQNENVAEVQVHGTGLVVTNLQGTRYTTTGSLDEALMEQLIEQAVPVTYHAESNLTSWIVFLIPLVLLLGFLLYFVQKSRVSATNILSLRKSTHREISSAESRVTFADVGGCEEAKKQLGDVVDFLKSPNRWLQSGV